MIFEEIKLYNFGIYKGEHIVSLNSPEPSKPVILIGALNGAGKTTFLDALQLALYGKHAKCSNRGKLSYSNFLEKNINNYSDDNTASVRLRFRHGDNKRNPQCYEIERTWHKESGKECRESVIVKFNNEFDMLLSDNWDDFVNDFIPQAISELFFFDGEKIENLADPKRSAELLRTGIEALLGLEMLSKLSGDLNVIKRRKQEKQLDSVDSIELESIKKQINTLNRQKDEIDLLLDSHNNQHLQLLDEYKNIQNIFAARGADKLNIKDSLDEQKSSLDKKLFELDHEIIQIIAGVLPLGLIKNLISTTQNQLIKEKESKNYKNAENLLRKQQEQLLNIVLNTVEDKDTYNKIRLYFEETKKSTDQHTQVNCYLNNDDVMFKNIIERVENDKIAALKILKAKVEIHESLNLVQRKLATIPTLKDVQDIIEEKVIHEEKINNLREKINLLVEQHLDIEEKIRGLGAKYDELLLKSNAINFEEKRQQQIVKHINTLQLIVNEFNEDMIQENINKLEKRIKSKFDQLKRKSSLIEKLEINPIDFSITLYSSDRKVLSPERLSAGERQLFAIAILWGLADSSGKELPTIIDTPMGRLDGEHRTRLIENYFPFAANQVILLSTDEEIYGKYYNKLKPYIAEEYNINYDEQLKTSTFNLGYIGNNKA